MALSIDHAYAAQEIMDLIVHSLKILTTPTFPFKIGRLYLLSDILHNASSSVPNAWRFREGVDKSMGDIMKHWGYVWKGIKGRLSAEQVRRAVWSVLAAWDRWIVFPPDRIAFWRQQFEEGANLRKMEEESQSSNEGNIKSDIDMTEKTAKSSLNDSEGGDSSRIEKLNQESMEEDVDGVSLQSNVSQSISSTTKGFKPIGHAHDDTKIEEEEDGDGVPLVKESSSNIVAKPFTISGFKPVQTAYDVNNQCENRGEDDEEEDIDGVPFTISEVEDEEEDVDGVPLDASYITKPTSKNTKGFGIKFKLGGR